MDLCAPVAKSAVTYVHHELDRKKIIKNRPNDQLSVGLLAQLVRALHRYRRGHRSESRTSLIFFAGFLFITAKVVSITTMIFFLSKSNFPQFKYMIFIYSIFHLHLSRVYKD